MEPSIKNSPNKRKPPNKGDSSGHFSRVVVKFLTSKRGYSLSTKDKVADPKESVLYSEVLLLVTSINIPPVVAPRICLIIPHLLFSFTNGE